MVRSEWVTVFKDQKPHSGLDSEASQASKERGRNIGSQHRQARPGDQHLTSYAIWSTVSSQWLGGGVTKVQEQIQPPLRCCSEHPDLIFFPVSERLWILLGGTRRLAAKVQANPPPSTTTGSSLVAGNIQGEASHLSHDS